MTASGKMFDVHVYADGRIRLMMNPKRSDASPEAPTALDRPALRCRPWRRRG